MNARKLRQQFMDNPTDYALMLPEIGKTTTTHLILCCLKAMDDDSIKRMLDNNELSPRFITDESAD